MHGCGQAPSHPANATTHGLSTVVRRNAKTSSAKATTHAFREKSGTATRKETATQNRQLNHPGNGIARHPLQGGLAVGQAVQLALEDGEFLA